VGVETELEMQGQDVTGVAFGDGVEEEARAFGLFGGKPGSANEIRLVYPDGSERRTKTKEIIRGIPPGTRFCQKAGGGGGYGDPFERPPEAVLEDVRNGLVSIESAREDYGVCIDARTLQVDAATTTALRRTRT
jgi:N-methylhydantoinase B